MTWEPGPTRGLRATETTSDSGPTSDSGAPSEAGAPGDSGAQSGPWKLVWTDEFDGPSGSAVDPKRWTFDVGGDGWGNQELEYYTRRTENAALDGAGNLAITARAEAFSGKSYTSARLKTQGIATFTRGRFEARIKLPTGKGLWSAFWMLGSDIGSSGWPACGEIDVFENLGREPNIVHATIHGPQYSGESGPTAQISLANAVSNAFSCLCNRMGVPTNSVVFGRATVRDEDTRRSAPRGAVGLRSSRISCSSTWRWGAPGPGVPTLRRRFRRPCSLTTCMCFRAS